MPLGAQQEQELEEAEGARDHPLVSRYEGSVALGYEHTDYDRLVLPAGHEGEEMTDSVVVEGEVTRILYAAPEGLSSLQVHRNYQMALQDAGFQIVHECPDGCEPYNEWVYGDGQRFQDYDPGWLPDEALFSWSTKDERYFLARLPGAEGDVLISVYTALHSLPDGHQELAGQPVTLLQIVQEKPMPTGKVTATVDAAAMAEHLREAGTVRLYGIHFDTDEATIKSESETTLAEIGRLLQENPELRLAVVGHTDITGGAEHNMDLSRRRAEAVMDYLTTEEGISADRLEAHGVGYLAPVGTNETEEGRTRNRRVELVKLS